MPNQVKTSRFSIIFIETAHDERDTQCMTVLVYDAEEQFVKSFQEMRVAKSIGIESSATLRLAMAQFRRNCLDTMLTAYDLVAVKEFIKDLCTAYGVDYPFQDGYEVNMRLLAHARLKQTEPGSGGLRDAAERVGLHHLPPAHSPSWGAIVTWYMLKRIVGI